MPPQTQRQRSPPQHPNPRQRRASLGDVPSGGSRGDRAPPSSPKSGRGGQPARGTVGSVAGTQTQAGVSAWAAGPTERRPSTVTQGVVVVLLPPIAGAAGLPGGTGSLIGGSGSSVPPAR